MTIKRNAKAVWQGTGKEGKGALSTQSGVLKDTQYSFSTRFENGIGTNPEELIAAAHAGCFTMQLSFMLNAAGFTADQIDTQATLSMEKQGAGFSVSGMHLEVTAKIKEIDQAKFDEIAANAKNNCPISRLLKTEISMSAKLL
jgi:osmotically inducible protein OsmC